MNNYPIRKPRIQRFKGGDGPTMLTRRRRQAACVEGRGMKEGQTNVKILSNTVRESRRINHNIETLEPRIFVSIARLRDNSLKSNSKYLPKDEGAFLCSSFTAASSAFVY
jgi:hypothetical protein